MLTKTPAATFIRHYIEMVVVMFAGMIVLGLPGEAALKAIGSGTSELRDDAPAIVFLGMAATMTIPMVAWMRYRGHRWQPTLEMAASMIIPTLVAIALLGGRRPGLRAPSWASSTSRCCSACSSPCCCASTSTPATPTTPMTWSPPDAHTAPRRTGAPPSAGLLACSAI